MHHDLIELTYGPVTPILSKALRSQFIAEKGKVLFGGDFTGIEARINAWFSEEEWKLNAIRQFDLGFGPDLYKLMASKCLGISVESVTKIQRHHLGKYPELACVGGATKVLTNSGYKRIISISKDDLIWDGEEWCTHKGVSVRSARQTVNVDGIDFTPDHLVLTGLNWLPALELQYHINFLFQALATGSGNLPSMNLSLEKHKEGLSQESVFFVPAVIHRLWTLGSYEMVRKIVEYVKEIKLVTPKLIKKGIKVCYEIVSSELGFLQNFIMPLIDATMLTTKSGLIMEDEVYPSIRLGYLIKDHFWNMLLDSLGLTIQALKSTGSRQTEITNLETSDLQHVAKINQIDETFKSCKNTSWRWKKKFVFSKTKMLVYDLIDCGPRNRFTIKTNSGHFIVHNCGYQGSVGAWLRFDPSPTTVTRVIKDQFNGTEAWQKACVHYDNSKNHLGLEPDQWIAIKVVINSWREANSRIVQSWWDLQDAALEAMQSEGTVVSVLGDKIKYLSSEGFLWCQLPSGKLLAYSRPRLVERRQDWIIDADGEVFSADELLADEIEAKLAAGAKIEEGSTRTQVAFEGKNQKTGVWGRQYLYGGLQTNNIVQGTARELLRFAMLNVENAGYPITLHIHDEIVCEAEEKMGAIQEFEELMSMLPPWLLGLPLSAKAWSAKRYTK